MKNVADITGQQTFMAIICFLPDPKLVRVGERHVMNFKFIEALGYFIRIDAVEPFP